MREERADGRVAQSVMEPRVDTYDFLGLTAIVASPAMQRLLEIARRVARAEATVLIEGESGSGKEVIARAVHHYSLRCHRPWVDVSCGALPEHLMESELFGYERGAFSGADSSKPGLFEMAHAGTLFLDEVGELDHKMQVKLLRVLDGVPYYRLGGTKKIAVDVRVVAATNVDLENAVNHGRFRSDLFHRLSQFRLRVPPLRERPEDVNALAEHFLRRQRPELSLTLDGRKALLHHRWPGNVRELRNVITRAVVMAQDGIVGAEELGLQDESLHNLAAALSQFGSTGPKSENGGAGHTADGHMDLDGLEKRAILDALEETRGHRQRAAERLGISRRTLSRKLKSYGFGEKMA